MPIPADNGDIVSRIKELCKSKKLSVAKLEVLSGLGNGVIRKWASVSPSSDCLLRVAKVLDTSVDYLLTGEKKENIVPDSGNDVKEFLQVYLNLSEDEQKKVLEYVMFIKGLRDKN